MIPCALTLTVFQSSAQQIDWAFRAGGEGNDKIRGAAAGAEGAFFLTGEISGAADFGDRLLTSAGKLDFVVAKIASEGRVLWATHAGGLDIDRGYGVSPAKDGGCFATGHFQSQTIRFGMTSLTNAGDYDGFVARFDSQGRALWAVRFGGEKYDYGHGIATLPDGSPVVAGVIAGEGGFPGYKLGAKTGRSALLAKLSPQGNLAWSRIVQAPSASGHNVAAGADGSIALCGYTRGEALWPDGDKSNSKLQDVFVAKFDQDGKLLWRRHTGGAADGLATSVAIDRKNGAVCIAGMFKATARFDDRKFVSKGGHDFYTAIYSSHGRLLNAHQGGGAETDYALGATAMPNGGFAITGEISTSGRFNNETHTCIGARDAFIGTLSSAGDVASFSLAGGIDHDLSYAIAAPSDDFVVISGAFRQETSFGSHSLAAKSGNDLFFAKASLSSSRRKSEAPGESVFLLPYFLGNGETGVYLTWSKDGFTFDWLNDGKPILPAPQWPDENLTRDPSILFHDGVFHMVWTTSWFSRSIGYARSSDLKTWSAPKKIDIWGARTDVKNTWAPELHWDPERNEFLILWSTTTEAEFNDKDGSVDPHGHDHRSYAARTKDFNRFSKPELFYSPRNPEFGVIDPYIAHDDQGTTEKSDDRWVMVIKHEMAEKDGGKNLRLTFSKRMQGPYATKLGPPIVGAGTGIVNRMGEGPSLLKHNGEWRLYWDAPGSKFSYCLATSPDLENWTNRSAELRLPAKQMRHGTVLKIPAAAIGIMNKKTP